MRSVDGAPPTRLTSTLLRGTQVTRSTTSRTNHIVLDARLRTLTLVHFGQSNLHSPRQLVPGQQENRGGIVQLARQFGVVNPDPTPTRRFCGAFGTKRRVTPSTLTRT